MVQYTIRFRNIAREKVSTLFMWKISVCVSYQIKHLVIVIHLFRGAGAGGVGGGGGKNAQPLF